MPELIEVEQYRQALDALVGTTVEAVELVHPGFVRPRGISIEAFRMLEGGTLEETTRRGKVLVLTVRCGTEVIPVGLRFGMTGMLFVDGVGPIDQLEYASTRQEPAWDRLRLHIGGGVVTVRDQRRLGSIELDPDLERLGPEAGAVLTEQLASAIGHSRRAVKTALLDQGTIAGLGNLLADEVLWRAGIAPERPGRELATEEMAHLASMIRVVVADLSERGGSNRGDSFDHRTPGARCPRCDGSMRSSTVGGRTAWWCPTHQR